MTDISPKSTKQQLLDYISEIAAEKTRLEYDLRRQLSSKDQTILSQKQWIEDADRANVTLKRELASFRRTFFGLYFKEETDV